MANSTLKEVFCENLQNILSSDKNTREQAEQQLLMLETNEDFGLLLMEISLTENLDFSIRHLASVLLDRYISKHWTKISDNFELPEVSPSVKPLIRDYLLKSITISASVSSNSGPDLDHATKKLLSSFAHSLSKIAQYDWPSNWPELFPVLIDYLGSESSSAIYSALKVFKELSHEIIDTQIPNIAPVLLPPMLNIFILSDKYSLRYRSNAIKVFVSVSETIMLMNEYQRDSIKLYLSPHIPRFAEAVINALMISDFSPEMDICLKKDIIDGLSKFLKSCRKYFKIYMPKILELIWQALTTSVNIYVQRLVNSNSFDILDDNDNYSEKADSEGNTISFDSFIYSIIDFVMTIFESAKYRELIKPVLPDLLYYIMFYIQITDEQVESWQSNLERFIEDDDIDSTGYSVRIAAQDLIMNLARDMTTTSESSAKKDDEQFKIAFLQAIKRHFEQASEMQKTDPSKPWWKVVESGLYSLGIIAPSIIYTIKSESSLSNEYKAILDTVLSNTTHLNQPFLAGRSIWTASRFSPIMNDQSLDNFLKLTASLLSMIEQPILRIYALRSTYYFCDNVSINKKVHVIKPYLTQFLQGLVSIGFQSNSSDILYLVLQTIDLLLKLDGEFTASVAGPICTLATSAFLQYPDDPTIFDAALDLYSELFKIEQCHSQIQERILPTIISILRAPAQNSSSAQIAFKDADLNDCIKSIANILTLQPQVLDILADLVRHSPTPLPDSLIQQGYPSVITCLQGASKEDSAILQNGSECIRQFVAKGSEQLISYVDPVTNQNGIVLALNMSNNLLGPQIPESCSTFIGRLIITLILKANHVIGYDNIQLLLKSTLVKLNTSKDLLLTQGLVLVFAHLLYSNMTSILLFLNSLPAPDGEKSALEFVLDRWLSVQVFYNGYENKASTVALCQLFQHSLSCGDLNSGASLSDLNFINFHRIEVSCDDLQTLDTGAVRTRAKASKEADKVTNRRVPSTVKILKLLLNEYKHLQELKEIDGAIFTDDTSNESDSEEDENVEYWRAESTKGDVIDLTDLLLEDSNDGELEEGEILNEEIANIDVEDALRQVLRTFRAVPFAEQFFVHLTKSEKELLNCM